MKAKPLAVSLFFVAKHCKSVELKIFNKHLVIFYQEISYICKNYLHFKPKNMKVLKLLFVSLVCMAALTACEVERLITADQLPLPAQTYLQTNYQGVLIGMDD